MRKTPGEMPAVICRGIGRVAFLAHRAAIQQAVDEGWPLTAIYEKYKSELSITYSQFARYVARFIDKLPAPSARNVSPPPPGTGRKTARSHGSRAARLSSPKPSPTDPHATGQPRFEFDPKASDKDSLV